MAEEKVVVPENGHMLDYGKRHRRLEWRNNWFQLRRGKSDRELHRLMLDALGWKRRMIDRQRQTVKHLAGYAPAGVGTPWFSVGPRNVNGRVKSLAVHPTNADIVYAGAASGGVWKSTDGGQSWHALWDSQESLAIGSLALAPSAPNTIYVGTGEWTPGWGPSYPGAGLYVSTDAGATWTRREGVQARRIARVLVSPTDPQRVYVAGESGFETSGDGGITWATLKTGAISDAVIDPNDASTLYINVASDGIYKTTNAGAVWNKLANGPTGANADWIRLAIGHNGTHGTQFLLAKHAGTLYRTTDGGTNWTMLSGSHGDAGYDEWTNLVAVAPDDENIILAGGVGMERTGDGGSTWNSIAVVHADHHVAVFAPSNPNIVFTCNDGGVYRSDDKGATFTKSSHGIVITQFYDVGSWSQVGTVLGGGAQDQGTNMTAGGLTWRNISGADGGYFIIHPTDPHIIYAECQNTYIMKSTDGGHNWVGATDGLSGGTPWVGVMTMDLKHPDTLFVGTSIIFRTTDGCATPWVQSSQTLAGDVSALEIAPSDSNRVYAGAGSKIYRSDNGGATQPWADKSATLPNRWVTDIAVDQADANRVAVLYGGTAVGTTAQSLFLSTNGGDAWTDVSGNLPNINMNAVAFDPTDPNTI